MFSTDVPNTQAADSWLRWVPPPARWAWVLRLVPLALTRQAMQQALNHALARLPAEDGWDILAGRRIGVHVSDLHLNWVCALEHGCIQVLDQTQDAQATVAGSATDLLLLASRLEDADTLFFQRRLTLTGDVELGLTLRNLLDRLPWEHLPLHTRIVLRRAAVTAAKARLAYRQFHQPNPTAPLQSSPNLLG